jgi:integrase
MMNNCRAYLVKLLFYSTENLGRAVERYFIALKIKDKGYSARTFRKTFITLARAYGIDDSVVRELVGHSHSSPADRHYNKIQIELMKKELQKFIKLKAVE